jgi:hypothetical protein
MEPIKYRNYTIQEDFRNPYSSKPEYMFYPTAEGIDHDADCDGEGYYYTGNCKWTYTLEDAKAEIDAIIGENTTYLVHRFIPGKSNTITKFYFLQEAIEFCKKVGEDIGAIKVFYKGQEVTFDSI